MNRCFQTLSIIAFVMAVGITVNAAIIRVSTEQPTIQAGIDAAKDGDTVLVADGEYTGNGNRDLNFKGKAITVESEHGAAYTTINCEGTPQNQHRAFYFQNGEGRNSIVRGFTIKNGVKYLGGAILCGTQTLGVSPTIENNIIINNKAIITGNPSDPRGNGGAIFCLYKSSPMIMNNIIIENEAEHLGGAIGCNESSSPYIINNIIVRNKATDNGGAVVCLQASSPNVIYNTITGNSAGVYGGGIMSFQNSSPKILNTILWENVAREGNEIYVEEAEITVSYSDVQGGRAGIGGTGKIIWGDGNIDTDPLLYGNYHLTDYSPCIGKGTIAGLPPEAAEDIDGDVRPTPPGSNPDMGADEDNRPTPLPRGDVSGNGVVTAFDASLVLQHIVGLINLSEGQFPKGAADFGADVTGNKVVSALDAALILQYTVGLITKFPAEIGAGAPILSARTESELLSDAISALEKISLDREQKEVIKQLKYLLVGSILPTHTALLQNYPNPFNPETWLPYKLAQDAPVMIRIYNAKGQLVRSLHLGTKQAGNYITKDKAAYWDGRDSLGQKVASGVYFYTLSAGNYIETRRMVILK